MSPLLTLVRQAGVSGSAVKVVMEMTGAVSPKANSHDTRHVAHAFVFVHTMLAWKNSDFTKAEKINARLGERMCPRLREFRPLARGSLNIAMLRHYGPSCL